ncbi:hypothetical protein SETIT_5G215700v2 [Setaria italica]|uniref:ATP-dependent DNA helicase n=1 Tax=Setaria italica TaxID=4555 RepID=K3XSB3_SETIT|nr:hypothetical protein SETIT_5G215700v2 [Setaria italica]
MALVRKYGKPDIFLTMTCNLNWEEITRELEFAQTPQDRPDLVVRVFRAKLEEMKNQLLKKHILGKVKAHTYVVEFQKRGLPHTHFLLIMIGKYKYTCPEQYDRIISAELPDKYKYPNLYKMKLPFTKNRASCKNNYPRPFNETTIQGKDSYLLYRRRNGRRTETVRNCKLDNRWVVPYNPYLLCFFNCHINVEVCSSIKAIKYLFKYIYNGHDRASVSVTGADDEGEINEIRQYRNARWVTPPEALWRIYGFELRKINPSKTIKNIINRDGTERSMLTAYFKANRLHEKARGMLYRDFPEHYTWKKQGKFWQQRKQKATYQVGRIVAAHPGEGDRYYLRVLLKHVTGATCYEDLRTIGGKIVPTFQEFAEKREPIEGDNTIDDCMMEAEFNIRTLWNNHLKVMSEDYSRNCKCKHMVQQMVLKNIKNMLQSIGKDIRSFPLPEIYEQQNKTNDVPREIVEESTIEVDLEDVSLHTYLNKEQRAAYEKILAAVNNDSGGLFFVDGLGGIGKSFLYRALLATVHGQGKIALSTTTSGVIPLRIDDRSICSFTRQSGIAKILQTTSLIIWDEASMTKRQAVEDLDKSTRDTMDNPNLSFSGKIVVFGGDFRQVCMYQLTLVHNMRAHKDPWFAEYLLRIGNGTKETNENGEICLPTNIGVQHTLDDNALDTLIDNIYQTDNALLKDPKYITSRAILSTRNDCMDSINPKMIEHFQGDEMVYHSFDLVEDDPRNYYPPEFLNTLTPNGLPPHMLKLKINYPIILLRNINPANVLCNRTRLVVRGFQKNSIDAEIVLGQHSRMRVFLPRIPLCSFEEEMFPFRLKRKQFPFRLSFSMTINKSQGQTIPTVGVYLPEPVFSHGQLYVVLSRATTTKNIKILT